jgi:hypothetical protein
MRSVPCGGITWGKFSRGLCQLRRRSFGAWPEPCALVVPRVPPGSDDPSEHCPRRVAELFEVPANRTPRVPRPQRPCEARCDRDARGTEKNSLRGFSWKRGIDQFML